jgi:hypothetical protein
LVATGRRKLGLARGSNASECRRPCARNARPAFQLALRTRHPTGTRRLRSIGLTDAVAQPIDQPRVVLSRRHARSLAAIRASHAAPRRTPCHAGGTGWRRRTADDGLRQRCPGISQHKRDRIALHEEARRENEEQAFAKHRHGAAHFPLRVKSQRALTVTEAGSGFFVPAGGEKSELRGVDLRRCFPVSQLQRELGLAGDFLRRHHVPERQWFIMRAAGQAMLVLKGSTQRRPKTAPTASRGTVISCSSLAASISSVRVGNAKSTPNSFARSIIRSSISSRASSSAA